MKTLFFGLNTALLIAIAALYILLDSRIYQTETSYVVEFCRAEALLVAEQYGHGPEDVNCIFNHDDGWIRDKIFISALKSDKAPSVGLLCTKKYDFFVFHKMENCEFKVN